MNDNKPITKGNYLEDAVEKIQTTIIKTNPSLKTSKFTIERKKLIFPGGVRREIDLFVEVDPGNDMESIFLFECKNWENTVDPNSITIFNTKIEETNATKGFFIAKSFSKYAKLEAAKYPRVTLLTADDNFIDTVPFPETHMTYHDKSKRKIEVEIVQRSVQKNESKSKVEKFDPKKVFFEGKEITAKNFFMNLCEVAIDEKMKTEQTQFLDEGCYPYSHKKKFEFETGKLEINTWDIEKILLEVNFEVQIIKPVIVSKFDIESKGRYLQQEFITPDGGKLNTTFVAVK